MKLIPYAIAGSFAIALMVGCGKTAGIQKVSTDQTIAQTSSDATQDPTEIGGEIDLSQAASGSLLDAGYTLTAKSLFGIKVCDGEVNLKVNPAFAQNGKMFELPSSPISCLLGFKFDLADMMGAMAQPAGTGGPGIDVSDDVIGLTGLGTSTFNPARPLFPSFLATELDDLKRIHVVRQISLQNAETGESGTGVASLKVTGFKKRHRVEGMRNEFRDVITFEVRHSGFEGVNKVQNLLLEKLEMDISLNPVAITRVYAQGRVNDMSGALAGGGLGGGGGPLGGALGGILGSGEGAGGLGGVVGAISKVVKIEMELVLNRMEGLDDMGEEENEDEND